jgi:hypothetical protein
MDGRFRFGYVTDEELIEKSKYKGSAVFVYKPVCNYTEVSLYISTS